MIELPPNHAFNRTPLGGAARLPFGSPVNLVR